MGDTSENMRYDFFVSFASDAKEWVYGVLVPKLGRTGKRFALEGQELTGQFWLNDLQKNIEQSHTVLLILSPQYLTSERTELIKQMALLKVVEQRQWRVIPILLKSVERELVMRVIDGIDLTKNYENEDRLNDLLGGQLPSLDEQAYLATPPYPGMQAFTEKEAGWFFGREDEVDQYVKMLCDQQIVVLTGASGCGKSSLARAGIIPRLKAKHQFVVKTVRPIDKDLDSWLEQAENALKNGDESTKQFFSLKQPDQSFLLFIDQFEELFSTESDERSNFILSIRAKQLLGLLVKLKKQVPNFYLLITLRAEFYPQLALCQAYLDFDNYLQRINALSREGLTNAITKPALKKYVYIDERLVERLVTEAGDDPGILPFVQETLRDLWEKRYENYIGLEAYESLGGNTGSGLKASIAAKADAAYKALISIDKEHRLEKENITKRIFLRLIQFGEGKPDTRRQQSILDLRSDQDTQGVFEETLRHLSSEKYRLLTVSRGDGDDDSKVDIVHEALIEAWPKLRDWRLNFKKMELEARELIKMVGIWNEKFSKEAGFLDRVQLKDSIKLKNELNKSGFKFDGKVENYIKASQLFWKKQLIHKVAFPSLFVIVLMSFFSFRVINNYLIKQEVLSSNKLIEVPAGTYTIGSNLEKGESYYPEWKAALSSFAMEQYEVSNYLYCLCTKVGVCSSIKYQDTDVCDAPKNEPVSNVTKADAQKYCNWLDRRLPNEVEWEAAARTVNGYLYPSGHNPVFIKNMNIGTDMKVDIEKTEISKEGFYGLGGNVAEWTTSYESKYCEEGFLNLLSNKAADSAFIIRGGAAIDSVDKAALLYKRNPTILERHEFTGYRCISGLPEKINLSGFIAKVGGCDG